MENTETQDNSKNPQPQQPLFNPTDELMVAYGFLTEISDLSNYIYEKYGEERTKRLLFDKINKETGKAAPKKIPQDKLEQYNDVPAFARTAMGSFDTHLTELGDMMVKLQMRLKAVIEVNVENRIQEKPIGNPEMGNEVRQMKVVSSEEE